MKKLLIFMVYISALSACVNRLPPKKINVGWLIEGVTTRQQVLEKYGAPVNFYKNGRIFAYRIYIDRRGEETFVNYPITAVNDNLILLFNEHGLLKKQQRVRLTSH